MKTITIGVAGGSAAGKSIFSGAIRERIGEGSVLILEHDSYYKDLSHLPLEKRITFNFDHPDALETKLLIKHIKLLISGQSVNVPIYNFVKYTRTRRFKSISPRRVIIVEGILVLANPKLRALFDLKIFLEADADLRLARRVQRDVLDRGRKIDSVIDQYFKTVKPMHFQFVEPSKSYADIIVPTHESINNVAVDTIVAKIINELSKSPD